ncbi:flavodoxin I [Oikeobacillus pervagus]|uniref:Flavodoxin n=1 Tax=Oikeobacillus pervagus TaxID=1325931 RepID=A0AAJ1T2J3_9BACI|nr:flavodoxin [Oikeobacillus pervagus]MDQ0215617.1 flavodoxin I [Oikeobacillus pervagus]
MKVIIVYASMTGNTKQMARLIAEGIKEKGVEVEVKDSFELLANELLPYDGILLGSYTYGEGEIPWEMADLHEEVQDLDLEGKAVAAFGSGDTSYLHFARAVDILEKIMQQQGATFMQPGLKIEGMPENEEEQQCKQFGVKFAEGLLKNS